MLTSSGRFLSSRVSAQLSDHATPDVACAEAPAALPPTWLNSCALEVRKSVTLIGLARATHEGVAAQRRCNKAGLGLACAPNVCIVLGASLIGEHNCRCCR